ncbi:hypothetical protein AA12717_0284 [Gluconacetobacter sacchari DSM 12717]|uniref:Uncharacterized protein n=3 Tax=Gluconacetobacter sacchari TaxID=92759 RepID=A0A7W4IAM0_9PROT|nr:hypothetical protein [Gluconacetobacter sacchari]MBB2159369.1 hypothetical protein [Gluconacetobacter sacchari]GBQ19534.1 hypothetical protein AA12717_0284 [Gluconacetobacter sacchari DSM 12717]
MDGAVMDSVYLTRAEGREIRDDLKALEADMAVVKAQQAGQQQTLDQILVQVQKGNSVRSMMIAGGSGIGGGVVAGVAYLAHLLTQ